MQQHLNNSKAGKSQKRKPFYCFTGNRIFLNSTQIYYANLLVK